MTGDGVGHGVKRLVQHRLEECASWRRKEERKKEKDNAEAQRARRSAEKEKDLTQRSRREEHRGRREERDYFLSVRTGSGRRASRRKRAASSGGVGLM